METNVRPSGSLATSGCDVLNPWPQRFGHSFSSPAKDSSSVTNLPARISSLRYLELLIKGGLQAVA
jgi:hypothetical protein